MLDLMRLDRNPWSVLDELGSLQRDLNSVFGGYRYPRTRRSYPPMNVWSSNEGLILDVELPGIDPKAIDISVEGNELTLSGKINVTAPAEGETYHRQERTGGEFSRTLQLPYRADAENVKAGYKNGILRVTVPRAEDDKPKKIMIES